MKEQWRPVVQSLVAREQELVHNGEFTDPLFAVVIGRGRNSAD